jgi:predicted nucleic acid-binding protein
VNVAVDTNVLVYAEGLNGVSKKSIALEVLEALPAESTFLPVQVLGELFNVLVHKASRSRGEAGAAILSWGDAFPLIESSADVLLSAADLAHAHTLGIWDAVILAAAADARCRLLLSEDLHEGFTWHGVTVTNPFQPSRHPMLEALIGGGSVPRAIPGATRKRGDGKGRRRLPRS